MNQQQLCVPTKYQYFAGADCPLPLDYAKCHDGLIANAGYLGWVGSLLQAFAGLY